jgi:hypothetical protein
MRYTKTQIWQMLAEELRKDHTIVAEDTVAGSLGSPSSWGEHGSTGGGFVGPFLQDPLKYVSKKKLKEKLSFKGGEIVTKVNGQPVNEQMLLEWFGGETVRHNANTAPVNKKPFYVGGKFVEIKPKCQTFPYCSQGDSADKPLKLIGESRETSSPCAWDIVEVLAETARKTPEYIAKLIREYYLKLESE